MSTVKTAVFALSAASLISGGLGGTVGYLWGAKNLKDLEDKLSKKEVVTEIVEKIIIQEVEKERIVYKDKIKYLDRIVPEIVEREVYKNVCVDADGVDAFNIYFDAK